MQLETGKIKPRDYQWQAYKETAEHIRASKDPAFIEASVGAGKTVMIGMIAKRCQDVGMSAWVLARQGELIEQAYNTLWDMNVKCSVFSASLGSKNTRYPIITGTEGTVARALNNELREHAPDVLLLDECHMVDWEDSLRDTPETQYGQIISTLRARNPKLRIAGYTGSPFRGVEPIYGPFWKKKLIDVGTEYLVGRGYLAPTEFGFGGDGAQYDLSEFKSSGEDGARDFTNKELQAMQRKILKEGTTTQKIMLEVMAAQRERGGVALITCAGKKHCEEAAKYLEPGTYGIVTDATTTKERKRILDAAREERLQFVFQIGCLTTGVDVPAFSIIAILRNIGSLTLLVQLIGRALRPYITDPELAAEFFTSEPGEDERRKEIISISRKPAALVLDYSSTMHALGALYHNPILEAAEHERAKVKMELIQCPVCWTDNSMFARRCIAPSDHSKDGRCEHFWQSRPCEKCGTENDVAARFCRSCDGQLIDPNEKLTGKHYTDADYKNVKKMTVGLTSNGAGILITYELEHGEVATEVYWPFSEKRIARQLWFSKFVAKHVQGDRFRGVIRGCSTVHQIVKAAAIFSDPIQITHRINDKGRSIIDRKVFRDMPVDED